MDLQAHYDAMRQDAFQKLSRGEADLDALFDSAHDTRRGVTLLARPPARIKTIIEELLTGFQQLEPDQYYYPTSDIHLTILSIISCYQGFTLDAIDPEKYKQAVRTILQHTSPFRIRFTGLTASLGGIIVQGFPEDTGLQSLRNQVRRYFQASGLQQSIDQRYSIQTAHVTVVRFRNKLADPARLRQAVERFEHYNIGSFEVDTLELVYNDWYQRQENTILLETYPLASSYAPQMGT
jgi:2'-5' RNA ligase